MALAGEAPVSDLKICLFGGAQVSWGDGRQLVRLSRPSQVLLGFLVVNRHRTHQREVLASILWEEVDDARARHRINTALWRLRRALAAPDPDGDECIVSEPGGGVGFNPRACHLLDVAMFEDTIAHVTRAAPGRDETRRRSRRWSARSICTPAISCPAATTSG